MKYIQSKTKKVKERVMQWGLTLVVMTMMTMVVQAQPKSVVIDDSAISIAEAFTEIERQTSYRFAYSPNELNVSRRVVFAKGGESLPLSEVLDKLLKESGCDYKIIEGGYITVFRSDDGAIEVVDEEKETKTSIRGVVVDDESGAPISDAYVRVAGYLNAVAKTNYAGRFTIKDVGEGEQRIRVTQEGYVVSEQAIVADGVGEHRVALVKIDDQVIRAATAELEQRVRSTSVQMFGDRTATLLPHRTTKVNRKEFAETLLAPRGYNKWAIKTDALYWLTPSVNLGVEWGFAPKWSFEVVGGFNMFDYDILFKDEGMSLNHWLVKPELRYWFCRAFEGHFIGLHGIYSQFSVGQFVFGSDYVQTHSFEGYMYGGGLNYGYHWALGKRWGVEATVGVGYMKMVYDDYIRIEDCKSCVRENKSKNYFGPTRLGVSFMYFFK